MEFPRLDVEPLSGLQDYLFLVACLVVFAVFVSSATSPISLVSRNRSRGIVHQIMGIDKVLWTGVWFGYALKGTLCPVTSTIFYGVAFLALLGLLWRALFSVRKGLSNLSIAFLMLLFWGIVSANVIAEPSVATIREWTVFSLVWLALMLHSNAYGDERELLNCMFSGIDFLGALLVVSLVGFSLIGGWTESQFEEGIVGPFIDRVFISQCLAVCFIGSTCKGLAAVDSPSERAFGKVVRTLLIPACLLTAGRSGIVLMFMFGFLTVAKTRPRRFFRTMVACSFLILPILIANWDYVLRRISEADTGRMSLYDEQLSGAMTRPWLGHGYGVSKHTNFVQEFAASNWHASHNVTVSLLYDLGVVGVVPALLLFLSVSATLLKNAFRAGSERPWAWACLFAWFGCALVAQVENMFWNGNLMIETLVVSLIALTARENRLDFVILPWKANLTAELRAPRVTSSTLKRV